MEQHDPFESWILEDERLSETQESELKQHLNGCAHCRRLQLNWQQTRGQMRAAAMAAPLPGFSQRWQAGLAQRRMRQQTQVRRFFIYLIGINLFSFAGFVATFVLGTSPFDILSGLLHGSVYAFLFVRQVEGLAAALYHSVPLVVPIVGWMLVSTGFCLVVLIWALSIWRTFNRGVNLK